MGNFANTVFSLLLGWLRGLISMIWSALTAEDGESFFTFIGNNWITIVLILCAAGLAADFAVYFFRWQPYKVWETFLRRLKGKKETSFQAPEPDTSGLYGSQADSGIPEGEEVYVRKWNSTAPETDRPEPEDELSRWRPEPEPAEPAVSAEVTRAGYAVAPDSPYRRPAERNRRRRLRVSLLGDEEDGEVHYYAPRPIIDQKEAYHAPVYPEKWTGSREQDS